MKTLRNRCFFWFFFVFFFFFFFFLPPVFAFFVLKVSAHRGLFESLPGDFHWEPAWATVLKQTQTAAQSDVGKLIQGSGRRYSGFELVAQPAFFRGGFLPGAG